MMIRTALLALALITGFTGAFGVLPAPHAKAECTDQNCY